MLYSTRDLFSSLFLAVDAGIDGTKWDELACKMNKALCEQGYWGTFQFFFEGRSVRLP